MQYNIEGKTWEPTRISKQLATGKIQKQAEKQGGGDARGKKQTLLTENPNHTENDQKERETGKKIVGTARRKK